ncbi:MULTISPECIES: FxsA family membrane protein [unclassified Streptomyces]|uniref:FxsA family membrane protein n=1 Tax=unclassified Streptomyces TaxID=2593676 RepID=UPI0006AF2CBB|nr:MULTISPECIES: FxsA family membrane protein [unclassified Streptomyces]KOX25879.1 membrane protein [Streptomyces sp. NRRL F-6491]KOX42200.1 membrane protein [Streptomyces sp. NRRL F-6492]
MTTGVPPSPAPAKRSRARTFLPLGLAAWLVLEIWLLTVVAGATGGLTVLALLVVGAVLGTVVVKRAGRRAFRNLTSTFQQAQEAARTGGVPSAPERTGAEDRNGFLMLGGLLLMLPGLVSDVAGLLLLIPPVRSFLGRRAERAVERRMAAAPHGGLQDAFQQARIRRPDGKVVQGEVVREDAPRSPYGADGPRPPLTP